MPKDSWLQWTLFENVSVNETIKIICDAVYAHPDILPPFFSQNILKALLIACTTETQFRYIDGTLYYQIDGIAMGFPLGVIFANFSMVDVKRKVTRNHITNHKKNRRNQSCTVGLWMIVSW